MPFLKAVATTSPEAALRPSPNLEPEIALAARFVRQHTIASIYHAGSGHPGGSLSCADILAALFGAELNVWPSAVDDPARDRFVLSKGHAAPALYAAAAASRLLRQARRARPCARPEAGSRAIRMSSTCPGSRPAPARSARASRSRSAWRWG